MAELQTVERGDQVRQVRLEADPLPSEGGGGDGYDRGPGPEASRRTLHLDAGTAPADGSDRRAETHGNARP